MVQHAYQQFVALDAQELWDRIDRAQARFTALVESVGPDLVAAGSTWTTRDVVGHLLTVARRYTERDITSTEGLGDSPRAVDAINRAELLALQGLDMDDLLSQLQLQMKAIKAALPPDGTDLAQRFPFHGGVSIDAAGGLSNLIGEFLLHGRDLAHKALHPWKIDPRDALLIINGVLQIIPGYAEPTATAPLKVRLRAEGAVDWMLAFDQGKLDSRPAVAQEAADVVLKAPPETLLLVLYSRIGATASLRMGLRVVGGRRPWRVTQVPKYLQQP